MNSFLLTPVILFGSEQHTAKLPEPFEQAKTGKPKPLYPQPASAIDITAIPSYRNYPEQV